MASLSRGLGLRLTLLPGAPLAAPRPLQPVPQRLFSTISSLRAAKAGAEKSAIRKAAVVKPKPKTTTSSTATAPASAGPTITTTNPAAYGLIKQLAQKGSPTLLYESGSHFWMKASTWGAATMFYSYAVINYSFFRDFVAGRADEIGSWVTWVFGAVCIATAGFGSYFFRASHNIVKTIRAVPAATLAEAGSLPRGVNPKTTPILLEIQVKRLIPGLSKKIVVAPEQVKIPYRVFQPLSPYQTTAQARAQERKDKAEAKKQWEYDQKHLMTVPIRHAGSGMKSAWFGIQRALTKSGFMKMEAGGEKLKLDVASGWALEDGRALDRLVTIEK
ncbi:uncharacterized protein CTRU02_212712 [Colletotrichum truncatum]|uniref:Uncharacterized protein n=1 Tax=Colletotrichum truncatum TaxID=5467 RepID=A0ACC3YIL5_COLTU|nr:uncharacterized protein CTRU02_05213 [Colletotrichum truncatum]KAF6794380.1 hypothetical protein CTRU02_05213 [Colletotrichum truncatum]